MIESQAPMLEMLWEPHEPRQALDERFGFGDAESAGRWVAAMLIDQSGVPGLAASLSDSPQYRNSAFLRPTDTPLDFPTPP